MLSRLFLLSIVVISFAACKKGDPVKEFYFGSFTAELITLPGTPEMDIYVETEKRDTINPGQLVNNLILQAGKQAHVYFKQRGTGTTLLDTVITPGIGQEYKFTLAWSEPLGMKEFVKGGTAPVHQDSIIVRMFNQLPVEIMPNGITVDAYAFRTTDTTKSLAVLQDVKKGQLHPEETKLAIVEGGVSYNYIWKFKNTATGEYLKGGNGQDFLFVAIGTAGRYIVTAKHVVARGKFNYSADITSLPY
jgi:hypothetical protein